MKRNYPIEAQAPGFKRFAQRARQTRRAWLREAGAALAAVPMSARPLDVPRNLALNRAAWASSASDFVDTGHMATDGQITTKWSCKSLDPQWIYVDLGASCTVSKVILHWGNDYARAFKIQVSLDQKPSPETGFVETWTDVYTTRSGAGNVEEIPLAPVHARYVRLLSMAWSGADGGCSLLSFEVYGTGGPAVRRKPLPSIGKDGILELSAGWKLINQSFVTEDASRISTVGYDDAKWLLATVPGTVLTTYLDTGAVPDPFYGDHQRQVSDWFSRCQWWYRNEVDVPASYRGLRVWLNLDGINHRAEIWVNGVPVGKMAGAFIRGRFDVTERVTVGKKNCIAVLSRWLV